MIEGAEDWDALEVKRSRLCGSGAEEEFPRGPRSSSMSHSET
jgi:hypothetical protein